VSAVSTVVGRIAAQGDAREIDEFFKSFFAHALGEQSTSSSSTSWAEADLYGYMERAAANAPLFIEAFVDGCQALPFKDIADPSTPRINRLLQENNTGYRISVTGALITKRGL
jgi:hypothetical protein